MFRLVRGSSKKSSRSKQRKDGRRRQRQRCYLEALEPRLVLSADLAWAFELDNPLSASSLEADVHEADEHVLTTDLFGNQLYSEPLVDGPQAAEPAAGESGSDAVWQGYDLWETFSLHSLPDADHVIYLDFNGHVTSGTSWNDAFASGANIVTPAWSSDGDRTSFSDFEKALIQRVWARVAEDFAPFDVDVTTEEPPLDRLIKSGTSDTQWGMRAVIGPNTWFDPAGGVAYVGSFNWSTDAPCFVFNTSENGITEAISHEAGHTLGLGHDGNSSTAYYTGHGSGINSWGPIMGAPYSANLTQWDSGEYYGANNAQDDLTIISSQNGFGYRPDDFGDTLNDATALIVAGQSQIDAFYGVVETSDDYDMFCFQAGAGNASLAIDPLSVGPDLDILAELYNSAGTLISSSNPINAIDASFTLSLPAADNYFLRISGTGRGNPLVDGYSDYGSLGNYRILGTVTPYTIGNTPPVAVNDNATTAVSTAVTVDVLANDTDANSDPLGVASVTQGSHGAVVVNSDKTVTYTPTNTFIGVDTFTYTLSDDMGGYDTAQVTVTVTAPAALINGGFEQGLLGWETTGDVTTQTSSFGESPAAGQNQGLLTTANAAGGNVTVSNLEAFLGLGSGMLDAIAPGTATAGSAMRQQVTALAGQTLVLQYNFVTNETTPDNTYNDFSFFAVAGPTGQQALLLADTTASGFQTSPSIYKKSTGYRQFSYTFPQTGSYTIGFGVSESKDTAYDTAVLVDAVSIGASPNNPPTAINDGGTTAEDQAITINVAANDFDTDGDSLSVASVTQGASGTVVLNGNDTVTYTPYLNYHGSDTFTYTICDDLGSQATATVTVTVTPVNDVPVGTDDQATTIQTNAVTIAVLANDIDVDGDTLSIAGIQQPNWGNATLNPNGTITYSPNAGFHGTDVFGYTATDGHGGQVTCEVTVTVTAPNDPPTPTNDSTVTNEETAVTIGVLANDSDPNGDMLTVAGVTQPSAGTAVPNANHTVTYVPAANYHGTESFTYSVVDEKGGQATATVIVTVLPVNDAPTAVSDNVSVVEDGVVTIGPAANDSDVDGDALTVANVGQAASGAVVLNGNGTVTYTPQANFSGNDTFAYTVVDGHGGQATGAVIVTVLPVNDAPVAVNDAASTAANTPVNIVVLSNDGDVDGDLLTVTGITQPGSGHVGVNVDNSIAYTPNSGFSGQDTFTYTVNDGHNAQSTATVTVSVSASTGSTIIGGFEDGLTGWEIMGDVTTQDSSFGEAPVSGQYQAVLTTVNSLGGNVTIADLETFLGLSSGKLDGVAIGTATAGSAIRKTLDITAGQTLDLYFSFLTKESTPDDNYNDFSFITVTGPGLNDAFLLADTHTTGFTTSPTAYTQSTGYRPHSFTFPSDGQYTIGFGVSDSRDTSYDTALLLDDVSLSTTEASNSPPVAVADAATTAEDVAVTVVVLTNDSDPDGDVLTVTSLTQAGHGFVVVNGDNSVTYTPQANYHGLDAFTYTVDDGLGGQATAAVTVNVTSLNDAPVALNDAAAIDENTSATVLVLANDTDVDGDTLSVSSVTQAAYGTVVIANNSVVYTPGANFVGQDTFSYTVGDGWGGQDSATVTVTVNSSSSGVVNGGFEDALEGWEFVGDATAQTSSLGESPVAGQLQAVVTTTNTQGGNVSVADLEVYLGLAGGTLNNVTIGTATAGSAIRQVVNVAAGQALVFQYDFATNENAAEANYNDFSFLTIVGGGVQTAILVADTHTTGFATSDSTYKTSTGYRSFSYAFPQAGQYTIGFGVSDAKDTSYDSALLLDAVKLQAAPASSLPETPVSAPVAPLATLDSILASNSFVGPSLKSGAFLSQAISQSAFGYKLNTLQAKSDGNPANLLCPTLSLEETSNDPVASDNWGYLVDLVFANMQ